MKRTTALLLAAILCLCLAACGKAPEPEQNPAAVSAWAWPLHFQDATYRTIGSV